MKKRYCCHVAVALCLIIFFLYETGGDRFFSALCQSEMEKRYSEEEWITLEGVIENKIYKKEEIRLLLREKESGEKILVSLADENNSETFKTGQKVQVTGNTAFFQKSPNPGNFNQKEYYQKQNITMSLQDAAVHIINPQKKRSLWYQLREKLTEFRCKMSRTILSHMGEEYGGILCAMLLGDDAYLNETWKELLQKSGIGHLLAISSLHVSRVGMSVYKGMRKTGIPIWFSAICSSALLCSYVIMTGNSTSAIRSCIMFVIRMGAYLLGREYDGLTALAVAAIVILARQPIMLFDAGFLLSFGAVLGIYLISPMLKLPVGIAISVMIFPIQLYFYYEYCFYSLLWNLIAIPLATIIIGSGFVGLVMVFIGKFPELLLRGSFEIARLGLAFYCRGSELLLQFPGARGIIGRPEKWWIAGYYFVLLLCLLVSEKKRKKRSKGGREIVTKVGMCIMVVSIWFFPHGKKGEVEIVMLNVGQGDCFFVRGPGGGTYLIDGGSSSVKQVGKYRIETFLKFEGVGKLDYVWVSHGDSDHLNGIVELLERKTVGVDIENLVLPAKIYWNESLEELAMMAQSKGTTVLTMAQGERVMEEQMQMQCLWGIRTMKERKTEEPFDENQISTVLSLEYGDFAMLFTGDLEKEAEESVASYIEEKQEKGEAPQSYEILKVGHHGSKNGTGEHLLTVVNPVCAWVSAGEGNRYGHPSQEVVERLAKWEVNLYNTKDGSAVKLCTDGKKYCILRP